MRVFIQSLLCISLLVGAAQQTCAELLLNGLGVHSELNQEIFIGAYYSESLSADADAQFDNALTRRMEVRVSSRFISARRSSSLWIEGIAINTPQELLTDQASNVSEFASLINHSLRMGDQLTIEADGNSVTVSINGLPLGSISSPSLFNMLLSTWIGEVPLSSSYRDALLGNGEVNQQLLARFDNIKPAASRRQIATRWIKKGQPDNTPASAATEITLATPAISGPTLNLKAPTIGQFSALTNGSDGNQNSTTDERKEEESTESTVTNNQVAEIPSTEALTPITSVASESSAEVEDEIALTEDEEQEDETQTEAITAESLVQRKLYQTDIIRNIYQSVRYPKQALKRNQEGKVQLSITLDREGKIINVTESESSPFSSLNQAAIRAINKAEPFPPIPEQIAGASLTFSIPIVFKIPR